MNKAGFYFIAIGVTLTVGCSKKSDTTIESQNDKISYAINGTSWSLRYFDLGANTTLSVPNGQQYTIIFSDTTAIGSNDCNLYSIAYSTTSTGTITAHGYSSTKIYCGGNSRDSIFVDGLRNLCSFEIIDNIMLTLYYSNKTKALCFLKQ